MTALRTLMRDPGLPASPAVDHASVRVTFEYLCLGTVWLLVGTTIGLIASIKLHWPEFLPFATLSFGRIRPAHTSLVLLGWGSLVLVGVALYVVSRTSRVPLWSPGLARTSLALWNVALAGGLVTLLAGVNRGPQEYREWLWPLAVILAAAVLIDGYVAYRTVAARTLPEVYVSNWYILRAFCYLPILYVASYLPFYQGGIGNTIVQGYYMHNAMGMWFTQLALGMSYYAIPRLLGRPVYSYALGVLGFWTNLLFYPLIGAHHFIFSAVPWWIQSTAILFSVGMMVPVWAGTGNLLLTFKGFIAFIAWGGVYGLMPRLTGREPSPLAVGVHFWLALVGVLTYVIAISTAGILQGLAWVAGQSFIVSVIAAEPMWLWRTIGGLLMVGSHIVFAMNVWAMRPLPGTVPSPSPEAVGMPA